MSLQVWLPLNGDLNNLGLRGDIAPAATGATIASAGKTGSCMKITNNINIGYTPDFNNYGLSLGGWFKFNQSEINTIITGLSYTSSATTPTGNILGNTSYGGIGLVWTGNNYYSSNTFSSMNIFATLRTSTVNQSTSSINIEFDKWIHIMLTWNPTTHILSLYKNGNLVNSKTFSTFSDGVARQLVLNYKAVYGGNGPSTNIPFYANDVRIYDHCLSTKEVEEIAKGLVLHYKLDNNGIGNENILLNTHFDSRYNQTSGWDTSKNGTLLANSWGGYNSGVTNASTVYHAHLKELNGEYIYEYIKDANNSWLGISQGGLQSKLIAGQQYTFSWEQYGVSGGNYNHGGLYYYKTGATSAGFHIGSFSGQSGKTNGIWQKFSYTFTAPSDADYSKNISWYIYGHNGGSGTLYMRRPKLEKGSVATAWAPAQSDALYSILGVAGTIYDTSGYGHHAVPVGTIAVTGSSPRYSAAAYIQSTDPTTNNTTGEFYIDSNISLTTPSQISIAWWAKPENGYNNSIGHAMWSTTANGVSSDYQVSAFNHRDTAFDVNSSDGVHLRLSTSSFVKNEWHHYVVTYDGQTAKLYRDGVQQSTVAFSEAKTLGSFTKILIGHSRAGGVHRKMLGSYSDFRVYTTALSVAAIKELYDTSTTIDKDGNVYAREVAEI